MSEINDKYECDLNDSAILLGGSIDKFVPNINFSKWSDECFFNINQKDLLTGSGIEQFEDGSIELIVGNIKSKYYVDSNGRLQNDVFYADNFPTYIDFNLTFSEGLDFRYQPSLQLQFEQDSMGMTHAEFMLNHSQPDDVDGSYAVYWKKSNNQYKTGKFCHIYAYFLIDAKNNKIKIPAEIDGSILRVYRNTEVDSWLKNATYPINLDPNFGLEAVGANSSTFAGRLGSKATSGVVAGTLDSITFYPTLNRADGFKAMIYKTSDASRVGYSGLQVGLTSTVPEVYTMAAETIDAATEYLVAMDGGDGTNNIPYAYDTGVGTEMWYEAGYQATPENPWVGYSTIDRIMSIFATYTLIAVGGSGKIIGSRFSGVVGGMF